jgi:hypothetical protein
MATKEQLQAWLDEAIVARHRLQTGQQLVTASYYGRSVNYAQADATRLDLYISRLEALINGRARAKKVYF